MNLFVYGTLMQRNVLERFVPGKPAMRSATLVGFEKGGIRGLPYPAVVSNPLTQVSGQLVLNIPNSAWKNLDDYEGQLYRRQTVTVINAAQKFIAQVYVLQPNFRRRWHRFSIEKDSSLIDDVFTILQQHAEGIREYEMLEILSHHPMLQSVAKDSQLALFQKHFLLMNALYQLQQSLSSYEPEIYSLEISPLNIQLKINTAGETQETLPQKDAEHKLAEYYLDWNHYEQTGVDGVQNLLDSFWVRYFQIENRAEALEILNLDPSASDSEIRQRYRELIANSHPDKGGDAEEFVKIRQAYEMLVDRK